MSLLVIEEQTKKYSELYNNVTNVISNMEQELNQIRKEHLDIIKPQLKKLRAAGEKLQQLLDENKDCFIKPKTQIFHGFKVGFAKGKGKKEFDNAQTVELIKKQLPDLANVLIKIEESVISKALDTLSVSDLKKIGVNISEAQDEIVIRPVDSEIKKIVDKIISETSVKEDNPVIILGSN